MVAIHPADRRVRTRFALLAHRAGYPETAAQLTVIEDRVWPAVFDDSVQAANFRGDGSDALHHKPLGRGRPCRAG